jgi:hypothetical protein
MSWTQLTAPLGLETSWRKYEKLGLWPLCLAGMGVYRGNTKGRFFFKLMTDPVPGFTGSFKTSTRVRVPRVSDFK